MIIKILFYFKNNKTAKKLFKNKIYKHDFKI